MEFVNRVRELEQLARWWERGRSFGLVWGRRRVGKTLLLEEFARDKPAIFHTFEGRPLSDELAVLSSNAAAVVGENLGRDVIGRPFSNWDDLLDELCRVGRDHPLLLILDEFPEALKVTPNLPNLIRGAERKIRASQLRVLICGSATRTMEAIQDHREPLYGRFDLLLLVHPFAPHEAALMLRDMSPSERALVWGLAGGVPLYLSWWDQQRSVDLNLKDLACTPGQGMLAEGELVMRGEMLPDLERQVLFAVAAGRTTWSEVRDTVRAVPTRSLENLVDLRLLERLEPVTETRRDARKVRYRIADNFLAFWLGPLARFRTEINRGLGANVLPVLKAALDDFMGPRWELAVRQHLVRLANAGQLGEEVVAIGPNWSTRRRSNDDDPHELDAVVLAGSSRTAVAVCEAKWTRSVDGSAMQRDLERRAATLGNRADKLVYIIAAREEVRGAYTAIAVTADDVFA